MIATSHSTRNFLGKLPLKSEKDTRIIKILSRTLSTNSNSSNTVIIFIYNAQKKRKQKNFMTMCT